MIKREGLHGVGVLVKVGNTTSSDNVYVAKLCPKTLKWETPGGKAEEHEELRFAAFREFLEETGLVVGGINPVYEGLHTGEYGEYTAHMFTANQLVGDIHRALGDHGSRVQLLSRTWLEDPQHAKYPEVMKATFAAIDKSRFHQ